MPKTVLITGCSSGIGKAAAIYFAERGWNVAATMRTPTSADSLSNYENISVIALDVESSVSIESAVNEALKDFGEIDVLINNAGYGLYGIFEALSREQIAHQFAVNVFGVMDVCRAVLPHFRSRKNGTIVNVSSGAGIVAVPLLSAYCSSKFALEGFSEGLYYELASQNIRVKILEPGSVGDTEFSGRSVSALSAQHSIPDYDQFVESSLKRLGDLADPNVASSDQMAAAIFTAATDGTHQLRYLPSQDILPLVAARRETSEEAYMDFMRERFMPAVGD